MSYYLYVSGTKLDMLYEQIPPKLLKRLAVEAKVDLKVLSVAVQSPRADVTSYDKLDLVEAYLEREFDVSWMTEPRPWFRGDLELRVAGYGSPEGPTFMTGRDGDTVIALIGSAPGTYERPPPTRSATCGMSQPSHVSRPSRATTRSRARCARGRCTRWAASVRPSRCGSC
nr:SAVMC3_10250 family protein [Streptomyces alfalfae]